MRLNKTNKEDIYQQEKLGKLVAGKLPIDKEEIVGIAEGQNKIFQFSDYINEQEVKYNKYYVYTNSVKNDSVKSIEIN